MMLEATATKCRVFRATSEASSVRWAQVLDFEKLLPPMTFHITDRIARACSVDSNSITARVQSRSRTRWCVTVAAMVAVSAGDAWAQQTRDGAVAPAVSQRIPKTAEELVAVRVAVVGSVAPHSTVRIAITFDITPSWHIYWENPGDSGVATTIALELPAGCVAAQCVDGGVRVDYPVPKIFQDGETTFGYDKSVTLSVEVTLPEVIPAQGLPVIVKSSWLVCKESCLFGRNTASVDLAKPVDSAAPAAVSLRESLSRLPTPLPSDCKAALTEVTATTASLSIECPGAKEVTFVPLETPGVRLESGSLAKSAGGALRVPLEVTPENALGKPLAVAGLLICTADGNNSRAYSFRIAVPTSVSTK